jgi:uncharacterized protein
MKKLIATVFLSIAISVGSVGVSVAGDLQKGIEALHNRDFATALREFTPLAEQGDASAQFFVGAMHAHGQGVVEDDREAVRWLRLAGHQGDADAQYLLGWMYAKGDGITKDNKKAFEWFRLAADQGNSSAQTIVGAGYRTGIVVATDEKKALDYFRRAAEQKNAEAQFRLGVLFAMGTVAIRDIVYSYVWLRMAESLGYELAREPKVAITGHMTPAQLSRAQTLARECVRKNYKDC